MSSERKQAGVGTHFTMYSHQPTALDREVFSCPALWCIYLDDLLVEMGSLKLGLACGLEPVPMQMICYACHPREACLCLCLFLYVNSTERDTTWSSPQIQYHPSLRPGECWCVGRTGLSNTLTPSSLEVGTYPGLSHRFTLAIIGHIHQDLPYNLH